MRDRRLKRGSFLMTPSCDVKRGSQWFRDPGTNKTNATCIVISKVCSISNEGAPLLACFARSGLFDVIPTVAVQDTDLGRAQKLRAAQRQPVVFEPKAERWKEKGLY